jgi:hypothetical protein
MKLYETICNLCNYIATYATTLQQFRMQLYENMQLYETRQLYAT